MNNLKHRPVIIALILLWGLFTQISLVAQEIPTKTRENFEGMMNRKSLENQRKQLLRNLGNFLKEGPKDKSAYSQEDLKQLLEASHQLIRLDNALLPMYQQEISEISGGNMEVIWSFTEIIQEQNKWIWILAGISTLMTILTLYFRSKYKKLMPEKSSSS